MPVVSVIIPTYGEPDLIVKAIDSVLSQTIIDLELIIVDDNDPNTINRIKTAEIVEAATMKDSRIIYLCHDHNMNGASARNTGIRVAKGEYIAFLDADDEYIPDRLEKCIQSIENKKNRKFAGVYTGCEFRRGGEVYHIEHGVPSGNFLVETLACTFVFCTGSNIFMRADVVKELQFDESFLRHQDYEFLVRYFTKYELIGLNEVLVIKNNENRNLPKPYKIALIKEQFLQKYRYIIEELNIDMQNKIYSSHYGEIAEAFASVGEWTKAREYYRRSKEFKNIPLKKHFRLVLLYLRSMVWKITGGIN